MAASFDNVAHDIQSILSSSERDYLVRNNGDQVKIESLKGKKVGLYFSAYWCPPCRRFTPTLKELYNNINEVSAKGDNLEIVYVSADKDEEGFDGYFQKMPWLAIPFSDSNTRNRINEVLKVRGIPHLVILDEDGKIITEDGTTVVTEFGAEPHAFTIDWMKGLKDKEDEARKNQTLRSLLVFKSRDFLVSFDGMQVPVSELEGKTVGLYFTSLTYNARECSEFTPKLVKLYDNLKSNGENFEIVSISVDDDDEESFNQVLKSVPWLALPYKEKAIVKLTRYFELSTLPTLVIIGPDGKTLHSNVVDAIEEHGVASYPFTPQKFAELSSEKPNEESTKKDEEEEEEEEEKKHDDNGGWVCDGEVCYKA